MKQQFLICFLILLGLSSFISAQKDTVDVLGYYESGNVIGTLNTAIDDARTAGTLNNTVFKLTPYEVYVLSGSILMGLGEDGQGEDLEIYAPKAGNTQETAPPQIVWTDEEIDKAYIIQTYGDLILKNVWVRYADLFGAQNGCSIAFEDSSTQGNDVESGYFENVLFDYAPVGADAGGAITVKADHFRGTFKGCYFRNLSDNHFQYYGRAVSYPYQSTGFHCDTLFFENCTFTNLSRVVMQEESQYADNIILNHCTVLNAVEWVIQAGRTPPEGWLKNVAITNSLFVNPYMYGYRALDVCAEDQDYSDFEDGLCDPPGSGGLISHIQPVDSFGFAVDFTDAERKMYIGNNVYVYQDWLVDYMTECDWCQEQIKARLDDELHHPSPMLDETTVAFLDSVDGEGNKVFPKLSVDWDNIYYDDPDFKVPATNVDTLKLFLEGKWGTGLDIDWSYQPNAGYAQKWPLPENLAYNNTAYQTAAMGGFPLGDLRWYPDQMSTWEAQRVDEWNAINNILDNGLISDVKQLIGSEVPGNYVLKQNYPNPFNPETKIEYSVPEAGQVSLRVYNLLGQEVATVFDGFQQRGNYEARFDGSELASGVYLYRLESQGVSISKKLVLMK